MRGLGVSYAIPYSGENNSAVFQIPRGRNFHGNVPELRIQWNEFRQIKIKPNVDGIIDT